MAPSTKNEGLKNTKIKVKRFIDKMLTSKEKTKKDELDDLVFDAVPDDQTEDEEIPHSNRESSKSDYTQNEENSWDNNKMFNESDEEEKEKLKWEGKKEKEESKGKRKPKSSSNKTGCDESASNVFNISDVKGTVHIGPTYKQSHTVIQNYNIGDSKQKENKEKKEVKLTPQIEVLMQSKAKLENRHIQCLSRHFGESWRKIGLKLKFSSGELDIFERLCKNDLQEISFQVLNQWIQKNGDKATIGKLCTKLWKSGIDNAQEAVEKLSVKMDLLKK